LVGLTLGASKAGQSIIVIALATAPLLLHWRTIGKRASSDYINSGNIYTTDPLTKVRCGSSSRGEFYCIAGDCGIQDLQGQLIHFGSSSTPVHSHWAVGYILGHGPSGRSSFHSPVVIKMFLGVTRKFGLYSLHRLGQNLHIAYRFRTPLLIVFWKKN